MLLQAQLIKWGVILFAVTAVVGGGYLYVSNLKSDLQTAQEQVVKAKQENDRLAADLIEATESKQVLIDAVEKAGLERQRIQAQLSSEIRKLRAQKPPQECTAAINWAVEQKADMEWSK
jgi:hypothetical protein